jgi:hypothetical protein
MTPLRRGNTLYLVNNVDRFADAEAQFPDWHVWVTAAELNEWLDAPGTLISPEAFRLQQQFRQGI